MAQELWSKSAIELAAMIRDREVSSREVVDAHLERIDKVNESINAVVECRVEDVRAEADAADRALRSGEVRGALHGVPFTTKTNIDVAGYASSEGSAAWRDMIAERDGPAVERLRGAGAVMLARTIMPDLGLRLNTESSLYGATHSPWRHGVTAGGSSGGEASAIAAGLSPIGLGNDIGGSLRSPAYACGIASIKPSRGRVAQCNESSTVTRNLSSQMMSVYGVLARRVADVRLGLTTVMGADFRDPQSLSAPFDGEPRPRRVALVPEPSGGTTDALVAAEVRRAGRALEEAGYEVEEVEPPMMLELSLAWAELIVTDLRVQQPFFAQVIGEGGLRFLELTDVPLEPATAASIFAAHQSRYRVQSAWRRFFADYSLVVGPTWTEPPFALGYDIESEETALKVVELARFVLPANLLGGPAACVPTGVSEGLPTGVQIIGDYFREDLCLQAAEVLEDHFGVLTPIDPRP
jgi:amidase